MCATSATPETEAQAADVEAILTSLGVDRHRPRLEVWNKLDLLAPEARAALLARADRDAGVFALSALTGEGLDALLAAIADILRDARHEATLHLPFSDGKRRAWLFEQELVQSEVQTETGYDITVLWTPRQEARFAAL